MKNVINNNEKETKLVFNFGVVRKLLKMGATIVDIKPNRSNADTGKDSSVFVFKNDDIFKSAFAKINEELAANKKSE